MEPGTHNVGGWRIELFGGLRAVHADRVITRFRSQKTEALLAYLAFHHRRAHGRDELAARFWPHSAPEAGRRSLRSALSSLRRQLDSPDSGVAPAIVAHGDAVQLSAAACVTDVALFENALEVAAHPMEKRAQQLEAAVALYRGELLPGCSDEWILPERERLAEAYSQALGELVHLRERQGEPALALPYALRAVAADPLRKEAH